LGARGRPRFSFDRPQPTDYRCTRHMFLFEERVRCV
jgi:hypothetical protein